MNPLPSKGFTWNIKSYFLWKTMKTYLWVSSAAVVIGALRVKAWGNTFMFSHLFPKGKQLCDFLFISPDDKILQKWGLLLQEKFCAKGSKVLPWGLSPIYPPPPPPHWHPSTPPPPTPPLPQNTHTATLAKRKAKQKWKSCFPWKCAQFTLG